MSKIDEMSGMFGKTAAFNDDISEWDVSSVQSMYVMFSEAATFDANAITFNCDISKWDVSRMQDMHFMWAMYEC